MIERRAIIQAGLTAPIAMSLGFSGTSRAAQPTDGRRLIEATSRNGSDVNGLRFTVSRDGHIIVPVSVNGFDVLGILDSGAGPTVFNKSFVERFGLSQSEGREVKGYAWVAEAQQVHGALIDVGGLPFRPKNCISLDLKGNAASSAEPIAVIVGREFFQEFVIDLDFSNNCMKIYASNSSLGYPSQFRLNLTDGPYGTSKYVPISVEGGPLISAVYDLGCASAMLLSPKLAQQSRLLTSRKFSTALSFGVDGPIETTVCTVRRVKLGRSDLIDIPVEILPTWNRSGEAVIGLPILRKFRNIIDYNSAALWLVPHSEEISAPIPKDRSGLGAKFIGDALKVMHIAPGSPAAKSGLVVGDEICAVDGNAVSIAYLQSHPRQGERPVGTVQVLTLRNGESRTIVLEDYY